MAMRSKKRISPAQLIEVLNHKGLPIPDVLIENEQGRVMKTKCMRLLELIPPRRLYDLVFESWQDGEQNAGREELRACREHHKRYSSRTVQQDNRKYLYWLYEGRYTHNIYLAI